MIKEFIQAIKNDPKDAIVSTVFITVSLALLFYFGNNILEICHILN